MSIGTAQIRFGRLQKKSHDIWRVGDLEVHLKIFRGKSRDGYAQSSSYASIKISKKKNIFKKNVVTISKDIIAHGSM